MFAATTLRSGGRRSKGPLGSIHMRPDVQAFLGMGVVKAGTPKVFWCHDPQLPPPSVLMTEAFATKRAATNIPVSNTKKHREGLGD